MRAIIWAAVSTRGQMREGRESLSDQVAQAQAVCDDKEWDVVDVLKVPGFSRRYYDLETLASEAEQQNPPILAPRKLQQHIQNMDFDILVTRGDSRLGRTQALLASIIEQIVDSGGQVYTLSGGFYDSQTFRAKIALGGFQAASEVDEMRKKQKFGYRARNKRGLPANHKLPRSHKLLRDPDTGKSIKVVVDEDKRQEFIDLATLFLKGVPYAHLERIMQARFGYVSDSGNRHARNLYYQTLNNPTFWGHTARKAKRKFGKWVWRTNHNAPDGVTVYRDTHEPMYTGDLAQRVMAELERRQSIRGRRSPSNTYKFSGLMICHGCGHRLPYVVAGNELYLRCVSRWVKEYGTNRKDCADRSPITESTAIEQIRPIVDRILNTGTIVPSIADDHTLQDTVDAVSHQIEMLNDKIRSLIIDQQNAPESTRHIYTDLIDLAGTQLDTLNERLNNLKSELATTQTTASNTKSAIQKLKTLSVDLWQLSDREINQYLHMLLGEYRFVVSEGKILGIALPAK